MKKNQISLLFILFIISRFFSLFNYCYLAYEYFPVSQQIPFEYSLILLIIVFLILNLLILVRRWKGFKLTFCVHICLYVILYIFLPIFLGFESDIDMKNVARNIIYFSVWSIYIFNSKFINQYFVYSQPRKKNSMSPI